MVRLAYFVSHPIQYQAPLLRQIAADPDIDLKTFFYSDFSLKAYRDPGFGQSIQWDVPLIEGYDHDFLKCWGSSQWKNWLQQPIALNLTQQIQQGSFDAIWVHGWSWLCSLQAILAAEQLGIPILLRGESHAFPSSSFKSKAKQAFLQWLFPKISAFLYIGSLNHQFYEAYGVSRDRLFHMPYAVDNDSFTQQTQQARSQRDRLRRSLNLDPNRPIILFAAKLIEVKRPQDLLAAYRALSPDGRAEPDPYLIFVGDGELRSSLETEAKSTGWDSIRFLGFRNQSELPALYDLCDVFVLPSSFEPWGLAINEVMNASKTVVVSDQVGCAIDLVEDGINGKIFPARNVSALASSMRWAIDHAVSGGAASLQKIQHWSYDEDLVGLKQALRAICQPSFAARI